MASAGEDVFHIEEEVDGGVSWGACGVPSRSSSVSIVRGTSTTLFRVRSPMTRFWNGGGLGSTC